MRSVRAARTGLGRDRSSRRRFGQVGVRFGLDALEVGVPEQLHAGLVDGPDSQHHCPFVLVRVDAEGLETPVQIALECDFRVHPGGSLLAQIARTPATLHEKGCSMKLMGRNAHAQARLHRLGIATAVAVFAALLVAVIGTGFAGAAPRVIVLGAATPAGPSCPTTCQAVGKTTGFQTNITGAKSPFVVTTRGRVVAWSIKTGSP